MDISKQVIILSAETGNATLEGNRQRTTTLKGCLEDCNLSFEEGVGVYNNGPEESSIVVVVNNSDDIEAVKGFAFNNFDQDSILYQDANQEAYLVYNDGTEERLGKLTEVDKKIAIKSGNYTLLNGLYFTTIVR